MAYGSALHLATRKRAFETEIFKQGNVNNEFLIPGCYECPTSLLQYLAFTIRNV